MLFDIPVRWVDGLTLLNEDALTGCLPCCLLTQLPTYKSTLNDAQYLRESQQECINGQIELNRLKKKRWYNIDTLHVIHIFVYS